MILLLRAAATAIAPFVVTSALESQEWVQRTDRPYTNATRLLDQAFGGRPWLLSASHLFEWDGRLWTKRTELPTSANLITMSYDQQRREVVAVVTTNGLQNPATYTFDGISWTLHPSAPGALTPWSHYDPTVAAVISFYDDPVTGTTQDWRWDGSTWNALPRAVRPYQLVGAMTADSARSRLVLVGHPASPFPGETWEWDGTRWQRATTSGPPTRNHFALGYDPLRQRTVLCGGTAHTGTPLNDTWEWDGTAWTLASSRQRPVPGEGYQMAFDRTRGTLLMFGRWHVDQIDWEWDGIDWRPIASAPAARSGTQLATDETRGRLVRLDGSGRTFEWDGITWASFNGPTPAARYTTLAWDPGNSVCMLFGGRDANTLPPVSPSFADTWIWNGASWSQAATTTSPPARAGHAMAYHLASGGMILFGGEDQRGVALRDTWLWNGTWTDLSANHAVTPPAGRCTFEVGVPFGDPHLVSGGELWRWNGSWQLVHASVPAGAAPLIGRDRQSGRLVLTGQPTTGSTSQSWEFDGSRWLPGPGIDGVFDQMAHDPVRGTLLAFSAGDAMAYSRTPANDAPYGSGCGNPQPLQMIEGRPRFGTPSFRLVAQTGRSSVPVFFGLGTQSTSQPLGSGCTVLVATPATVGISLSNASGVAAVPAPIPGSGALRGLQVFAQAAVLTPSGLALTSGLRITIGD